MFSIFRAFEELTLLLSYFYRIDAEHPERLNLKATAEKKSMKPGAMT
jgi:hypothetical protein